MSIRAYKLIEIKHAPDNTFNVWHHQEIVELADSNLLNENGGELSYLKTTLKEELKRAKQEDPKTLPEDYITTLKAMLKDCGKDDSVTYYCF